MTPHASSCALHNATASEPGPCDPLVRTIRLIGEPREGGYMYIKSPELPGFSLMIHPGESTVEVTDGPLKQFLAVEAQYQLIIGLRAALLKYGHHLTHCDLAMNDGSECTCGFEQARGNQQ